MRTLRVLVAASAALLACEGASAAYVPRLVADHLPNGIEITFGQAAADEATASLAFYVPSPYASAHTSASPGTTIGRISARVQVRAAGGIELPLDGSIVVDNPLNHASNSCSPGPHQAVWVASLTVPNRAQPIRIPIYVDATAGAPDAPLGAVRLQACLPSPDVPESQGGAPLGTKLLEAVFTLERVFTAPTTGVLQWVGRFVPYLAGTSTPNLAGGVESRGLIRLPRRFSLRSRRVTRPGRRLTALAGIVSEAGRGVGRAIVRIRGGGRTRTTTTSSHGGFLVIVPLAKTTTFTASVTVPVRDVTGTVCPPCVSATVVGFSASSGRVKVSPPRRTAKTKR
jgi:hypothetical protein